MAIPPDAKEYIDKFNEQLQKFLDTLMINLSVNIEGQCSCTYEWKHTPLVDSIDICTTNLEINFYRGEIKANNISSTKLAKRKVKLRDI